MKLRLAFATVATLIGLGSAAQAEILASAPVYGGTPSNGGFVVCRIFNAGLTTASISVRQIFNDLNVSVPLTADSCNVALLPSRYCAYIATVVGNRAHSCRLVATGIDIKLRGVAEVNRPGGAETLNAIPMQ